MGKRTDLSLGTLAEAPNPPLVISRMPTVFERERVEGGFKARQALYRGRQDIRLPDLILDSPAPAGVCGREGCEREATSAPPVARCVGPEHSPRASSRVESRLSGKPSELVESATNGELWRPARFLAAVGGALDWLTCPVHPARVATFAGVVLVACVALAFAASRVGAL